MRSLQFILVLFCVAFTACGPKPTGEMKGRGILVIAIDALRADHMSGLGYDRKTTPVLDSLAAQGVSFESAWSAAPEVLPAHAAILTGSDPLLACRPNVKVTGRESQLASWYIPDALPRFPQQFLAYGFETAAFLDAPSLTSVHGFAKGFQRIADRGAGDSSSSVRLGFDGVAARFLGWLNSHPPARSWCAYLHIGDLERLWQRIDTDPHWDTFFEPRPELSRVPPVADGEHVYFAVPRSRWSGGTFSLGEYEARYDGALRQLDTKLARLLESMRQRGWLENTTIVVVGTFGMSLGESGLYADSGTLSDCDLRVPLLIRPSLKFDGPRGHKSPVLASTIDIAPTLLDMHGIAVPSSMQGVSQVSVLRGADEAARTVTFASGGLQRGRIAIDARYCFEASAPGDDFDPRTVRSWYGDALDHRGEVRTHLHDREGSAHVGHLEDAAVNPEVEERLARVTREWFARIDEARAALHGPDRAAAGEATSVIDELVRRGLLGRSAR